MPGRVGKAWIVAAAGVHTFTALGIVCALLATQAALEAAFERAGAVRVRSFQTNGTVLFDPLGRSAARVIADVRDTLAEQVGYTEAKLLNLFNNAERMQITSGILIIIYAAVRGFFAFNLG